MTSARLWCWSCCATPAFSRPEPAEPGDGGSRRAASGHSGRIASRPRERPAATAARASQLRERLSLDNWRTINRLTQGLTQRRARQGFSDLLGELDVAIAASATLSGFTLDNMTRDPGWRFLSIGRRLERLQWLLRDAQADGGRPGEMDLTWLLRFADSIIVPRPLHGAARMAAGAGSAHPRPPRSVAFQLMG